MITNIVVHDPPIMYGNYSCIMEFDWYGITLHVVVSPKTEGPVILETLSDAD